jgi:hypothetical protein
MSNVSNDGSSNTAVVALVVIFVLILLGVYYWYPFDGKTVERDTVIEKETVVPGGSGDSFIDTDVNTNGGSRNGSNGSRSGTNGRGTTNGR